MRARQSGLSVHAYMREALEVTHTHTHTLNTTRVIQLLGFGYWNNSKHSKDWRCHKRGAQATDVSPPARFRWSNSRMHCLFVRDAETNRFYRKSTTAYTQRTGAAASVKRSPTEQQQGDVSPPGRSRRSDSRAAAPDLFVKAQHICENSTEKPHPQYG